MDNSGAQMVFALIFVCVFIGIAVPVLTGNRPVDRQRRSLIELLELDPEKLPDFRDKKLQAAYLARLQTLERQATEKADGAITELGAATTADETRVAQEKYDAAKATIAKIVDARKYF